MDTQGVVRLGDAGREGAGANSRPFVFLGMLYTSSMEPREFDAFVAVALGVCRSAARVELPIEEMLEHLRVARAQPEAHLPELDALAEIIASVADVAEIGARLPPESRPVRVPAPPDGGSFPVPANVLREA